MIISVKSFLKLNSIFYGLEVIDNFRRGEYVVGSRIFPLSVYCDFNIIKIGQPTVYTVKIRIFFFILIRMIKVIKQIDN